MPLPSRPTASSFWDWRSCRCSLRISFSSWRRSTGMERARPVVSRTMQATSPSADSSVTRALTSTGTTTPSRMTWVEKRCGPPPAARSRFWVRRSRAPGRHSVARVSPRSASLARPNSSDTAPVASWMRPFRSTSSTASAARSSAAARRDGSPGALCSLDAPPRSGPGRERGPTEPPPGGRAEGRKDTRGYSSGSGVYTYTAENDKWGPGSDSGADHRPMANTWCWPRMKI